MTKRLRVIFFGTPDFAVASLESIYKSKHTIEAVVTAPDRPAGRGKSLLSPAVKLKAIELGLEVLQPEKLKDAHFLSQLRQYQADVFVVVAFRMLPELIWSMPPKGCFNIHASLLPDYRGAAPINHVLMNGEKQTGITSFLIDHSIDTGKILLRKSTPIGPAETASELHDRLKVMGAETAVATLDGLAVNSLQAISQNDFRESGRESPRASKISKNDLWINWNRTLIEVFNHIRAFSSKPAARTLWIEKTHPGRMLKMIRVHQSKRQPPLKKPGAIITDNRTYLNVCCHDGWLAIDELQLEGKNAMGVETFLRGYSFSDDAYFESPP